MTIHARDSSYPTFIYKSERRSSSCIFIYFLLSIVFASSFMECGSVQSPPERNGNLYKLQLDKVQSVEKNFTLCKRLFLRSPNILFNVKFIVHSICFAFTSCIYCLICTTCYCYYLWLFYIIVNDLLCLWNSAASTVEKYNFFILLPNYRSLYMQLLI